MSIDFAYRGIRTGGSIPSPFALRSGSASSKARYRSRGWKLQPSLPGKSLHAGVALWYAVGLNRSRTIPLSNISGVRFGLDRNAKYRALNWLEGAGLIKVERKLGRAPVITILDREVPP